MLIILLSLALIIIFGAISVFAAYNFNLEGLSIISLILAAVMFAIFIVTSVAAVEANITKNARVAELQQEYQSLVYQLENMDALYGNSRANDKKALFDQIQEWNSDLASGRVLHESIWTNWLAPVDYEQFEYIEMK